MDKERERREGRERREEKEVKGRYWVCLSIVPNVRLYEYIIMNMRITKLQALALILIIFPRVFCGLSEGISTDDVFYQASRTEDNKSIKLNSANYRHFLSGISTPWLIFFYESLESESLLAYKDWVDFTLDDKPSVKPGIIDFSFEKILAQKLKIPSVPCYVYISEGYIYYYTGNRGKNDLERLLFEQVYLQYNRRVFVLDEIQDEPLVSLKKAYVSNPGLLISIMFSIFFTFLGFINYLILNYQNTISARKLKKD